MSDFEAGRRTLQVGVVDREGQHRCISSGPLPEAVAASAAIPCIFTPVSVPGEQIVSWSRTCLTTPFHVTAKPPAVLHCPGHWMQRPTTHTRGPAEQVHGICVSIYATFGPSTCVCHNRRQPGTGALQGRRGSGSYWAGALAAAFAAGAAAAAATRAAAAGAAATGR